MALEVSVVIPARDETATIGRCLAALAHQTVDPSALEVIVVAAGDDDTAGTAARAASDLGFGRFEVVPLGDGNKNVALQAGCARASAPVVILLDGDTELAPDAVATLARAVRGTRRVVHGAALPRYDTWISRYWELNRKLVKDLRFDGAVSGEFVALPRTVLAEADLAALFPEACGVKADLYLGRALAARGCVIEYLPTARGRTHTPWTLRGLVRTMLRSRRGAIALATRRDAAFQAVFCASVIGAIPIALVTLEWSWHLAVFAAAPFVAYGAHVAWRVDVLRRRGFGDHRRALPAFLFLDVVGRAIKLWAVVQRAVGRPAPYTFRGERPRDHGTPATSRSAA